MQKYEWGSDISNPEPGATEDQIAAVEARLGVRFPEALRKGFKSTSMASVFKRGMYCDSGVTGPFTKGGRILGSLSFLERIDRIEIETKYITEYVDD